MALGLLHAGSPIRSDRVGGKRGGCERSTAGGHRSREP